MSAHSHGSAAALAPPTRAEPAAAVSSSRAPPIKTAAAAFVVLVLYFFSGKLGLSLAFLHSNATPVWPPTGLSLAALLIFGVRFWPAIFIGAFLVSITTAGSLLSSLGVASGNTLEAVIGCWLVRKYAGGFEAFNRPRNILVYLVSAGILSTAVSATVGVTSLCATHFARWTQFGQIWVTWWMGDLVSNLIFAPFLILWSKHRPALRWHRFPEVAALFTVTTVVGYLLFGNSIIPRNNQPLAYLVFAPLVWGAVRFGPPAAVTQVFLLSAIAIYGTIFGQGRYAGQDPNVSLLYLQAFLGITSVISLVLAAVASQEKRVRTALADSDERYRAFVSQTSEGIWRFEFRDRIPISLPIDEQLQRALRSGYLAECNDPMARMYGFSSAQEILGRTISDFMPPDNPANAAFFRAFIESGYRIVDAESAETHRDGTTVYFLNNLFGIIEDGFFIRVWGMQRDITARKKSEDALRASEHRYRTLFDSIDEGFCIIEMIYDKAGAPADYLFLEVNPAFEKQTGLVNAVGKTIRALAPTHEAHWFEIYGRVARTGEPLRFENRAQALHRWYDVYAFRLGAEGSNKVGILFNDITARRHAEEQLLRARDELAAANRSLETKVAERTARLRENVGELEAYSYSISHDMRAPLRAMQSYAQILISEYHDRLDAPGKRYLERIMSGANRLDKLILDVLSYSRVSRAEIRSEPVHLDRLVDALVEEYPGVRSADIQIAHPLGTVVGAEALLTQVLSNLLTNAAKFVRPGQVARIRIWTEERFPDADAPSGKPFLRLCIRDNGIGISTADQERIFGMFTRLHTDKEYPGTGIGLSIVKKAIERMNGRIGLESEPGRGTTFWLELPKA